MSMNNTNRNHPAQTQRSFWQSLLLFFRTNRITRRLLIATLALIFGALAGIVLWPIYVDYQVIDDLAARGALEKKQAVHRAVFLGKAQEHTRARMLAALDTDDDEQFLALMEVMRRLGRFHEGKDIHVAPLWYDRLAALEFAQDPFSQADIETGIRTQVYTQMLYEAVLAGRDNQYVRQMTRRAGADKDPSIRAAAAALAAKLNEAALLTTLLKDPALPVASQACLAAGAAGRDAVRGQIAARLETQLLALQGKTNPTPPAALDALTSALWADVTLAPTRAAYYAALLRDATDPSRALPAGVQDRIKAILAETHEPSAHDAIEAVVQREAKDAALGVFSIKLALRYKIASAEVAGAIAAILQAATEKKSDVTEAQAIAAMDYASGMNLPCRKQIYELVMRHWGPGRPLVLVRAAKLLGEQVTLTVGQAADAPTRKTCLIALQNASRYAREADTPEGIEKTPYPSAAAAVALWKLDPKSSEFDSDEETDGEITHMEVRPTAAVYVRVAVGVEQTLPGDYAAWEISRGDPETALALAQSFLPLPKEKFREYNPEVRAVGALLLALSAKTDAQRADAHIRIQRREDRESFFTRGALQCALLMLGRRDSLQAVSDLLLFEDFPRRRALTALWVAGEKSSLDGLLWNTSEPLSAALPLLTLLGCNDVLAVVAPSLPRPDVCGTMELQLWQMQRLKQVFGQQRDTLSLGGSR